MSDKKEGERQCCNPDDDAATAASTAGTGHQSIITGRRPSKMGNGWMPGSPLFRAATGG
jgi:hypothetical protein